ncbi:hypothetical protein HN51_042038 [Arachis hypogaea]
MAEIAVNLVVDKLIPLLKNEAKLLSGVRGQIESISNDLRLMRAYLRDVDAKAENSDQSRKEWVAQMRQVSIHIQDVIDLYLYNRRRGRRNAVAGVLCKICDLLKSCVARHEIASEIGEIRESINRLKDARQLYGGDSNAAAESSGGRTSPQRHYLRLRANFAEEEELVGIEHAKKELNNWLSEGAAARTVIAVVGEGGLGKTTLVRNVYKQEQQKHSFDCYGWVDVSRSLKGVQLFKTLLRSFHDRKESNVDKNLHALIEDTREYLKEKKYLIVLDDVWETDLWGTVELALPKNNGMIMITTRDTGVADSCKVSAKVHTYPLKPLEPENALRLFHSKAFQSGSKNPCEALMKLSEEFTKKCDGVPLAIVAIASLLSTKKERLKEWKAVYNSLQSKLASDSHLKGYHQALSESYQDLSYHLKSCLLYFGLFPEQYAIKRGRLINLWIAEGFVECREHQSQREVGEEYLAELIARSLVKVADVNTYGRVRKCRVHDLMHDFIVKKCEEFNFCQVKKGKTILVRNVYKQEQQKHSFDCYGWVDVSRSLKGVQLFKTLLRSFHDRKESNVDKNLHALIEDTGEYLKEKKYLIVLDDVWETDLWGTVALALPKCNGMIMITTRDTGVADSCKVSAKVHTYPLKPLELENALRLFHSKAFQFGSKNPSEELMKLSEEFTKKCDGVPLAIVAIASLLSTKKERVSEWKAVYNSLQSKLASDSHLKGYHQALSESYQDLSYHIKSCLLYFGLFPEQYAIKKVRLINLWIAEGFVECREHQTQKEVGEEYLAELIARSLVKVAYVNPYYGRVRKCRVHDLMHDFIVKKCEEFNFCQVKKGNPFCFDKWSRRLSIGTNVDFADLRTSADRNQCSLLRSFLLYDSEGERISSTFVNSLFSNFKLLVTLDFEKMSLAHLPETIEHFVHLKYLNLRDSNIRTIPKSIGKLRNLETLDLNRTHVSDLPVEIYSLTKLCYLNVRTKGWEGVKLKRGVANLTALQKLALVDASDNVGELKNLKQLRSLKIQNVVGKDGMRLCNAIESMTNLCSLWIKAKDNEILELESLTSPPPQLERLYLFGSHSKMVPDWVFRLKNLIMLQLARFKFTQYQLCLVGRHMPELMRLYVDSFEDDELNIQKGWFGKLRTLYLWAPTLKAITIDEGSLPCLQDFFIPVLDLNLEAVQVPDHVRKLMRG